ncbi:MAG: hypothetical protein PHX21_13025 [bacterium]|nr:hypothetical protein [bacterium]
MNLRNILLILGLLLFSIGCCRIYIRPDWPEYKPYPKKQKVRVDTVYIKEDLYQEEPFYRIHPDSCYDNGICPKIDKQPCKGKVEVIGRATPYLKSRGRVIEKDM